MRATDIDDEGKITGAGAPRRVPAPIISRKMLADGDTLLEASGGSTDKPVGRVAYFDKKELGVGNYLCSNFFKTLRPRSEHDAKFVFWKLHWFYRQNQILALQQQTTGIINLKFKEYLSTPVSVPPELQEERKIAQILDTLDTQIRQTEALIAKLEQIKQGLITDLLTRGIDKNGELCPAPYQAPHLYKRSQLGWIPKNWVLTSARKHCSVITKGTTPAGGRMSQGNAGIRFLRVDNLSFYGVINLDASNFRISLMTHRKELARSICLPGDVLMNIVGPPLGKIGLVTEEIGELNINQAIALFRAKPTLLPKFLIIWLNSLQAKTWLQNRAKQTSGQVNLTLELCQDLPMPELSIEDQQFIIAHVGEIQKRIYEETDTWIKLQKLKVGLMDNLLTGHVRVP